MSVHTEDASSNLAEFPSMHEVMMEDDIILDIDERDEIKSKTSIDVRSVIDSAVKSVDAGKIYARAIHFCINNNENDQHDIIVMRRQDFKHLIGTDQVMQYRKDAEESHEFKQALEQLVGSHIKSLDMIAKDKNLTKTQQAVILKAVDAMWNTVMTF